MNRRGIPVRRILKSLLAIPGNMRGQDGSVTRMITRQSFQSKLLFPRFLGYQVKETLSSHLSFGHCLAPL